MVTSHSPAAGGEPADGTSGAVLALPYRLRLLCVGQSEPSWSALALHLSQYGCGEPQFRWSIPGAPLRTLLRDERFDCLVLLDEPAVDGSEEGTGASCLLQSLATSGCETPVVVIAAAADDAALAALASFDCEILLSQGGWQSGALPVWIHRAMTRTQHTRAVRQQAPDVGRREARERDESESLLEQQRQMLQLLRLEMAGSLPVSAGAASEPAATQSQISAQLQGYYQELLRTYVIVGAGNLHSDIRKLAQVLALAGVTPHEALQIHLNQAESLIKGLGSRSTRHVMSRADLLLLELLLNLGEWYQRKSQARGLGDFGIDLLHQETLRHKGPVAPANVTPSR